MDWIALFAIIISLLLIGFFSGIEIAFVSANKLSIELNKKKGNSAGITWSAFSDHPTRFIGTILVAVNIVLVIYGLLIGNELLPIWMWIESHLPHHAEDEARGLGDPAVTAGTNVCCACVYLMSGANNTVL